MSAKELNIGDYVRTKSGHICQIVNINEFRLDTMIYGVEANYLRDILFIGDKDINKSSPNIIDLIEVEDYVNGKLVTHAEDVYTTDNIYIGKEVFVNHDELIIEEDIENIVTKEQFESIEYKIGE